MCDLATANARVLGSYQPDAQQRITGGPGTMPYAGAQTGPFVVSARYGSGISFAGSTVDTNYGAMAFDNARTARTSSENRSTNVAFAPRIHV
ncbi:Uncharacterised protein [Bordetella ansorpii]|uniref:Uncharacterized protein n=1 Tax=Bordetella ansorpii TaxID=288768 RepID=A0A157SW71_9BORD|nr:hypothetical protein [Bordetella ansorpii]SAI74555.1 Uncharacterised protein [Bordetella ansorpii]